MRNRTLFSNDRAYLWFDDDPRQDLSDKITKAAKHYHKEKGIAVNLCYVHPSALSDNKVKMVGDVRVMSLPTVLVHHFWLGVEERDDAYRWRVHPVESVLAVVATLAAKVWQGRVDAIQGRLAI